MWGAPRINNQGDITFAQWNESDQKWETWLYKNKQFFRLPDFDHWCAGGRINDLGEVVWKGLHDTTGASALFLLRRIAPKGDFNHDCHIDMYDLSSFQSCFTGSDIGPPNGFLADCTRGDFDEDGDIDLDDVGGFAQAFTGPDTMAKDCQP